ncbi:unnamed protein product [Closterium sp. Naga37s-1]|nr:unnamed protein product [Closterium sp. Naga37s-1]
MAQACDSTVSSRHISRKAYRQMKVMVALFIWLGLFHFNTIAAAIAIYHLPSKTSVAVLVVLVTLVIIPVSESEFGIKVASFIARTASTYFPINMIYEDRQALDPNKAYIVRWPVTFQPALATPPHVSKLLALLLPAHQPQPRRLQPQIDLQFLKPLGRPFLPGIGLPSSARQSHLALFSAESPPASDSSFSMHFSFHCAALHNILLTSLHTSFSWHFRVSYCAYLLPLLPHSPLPLHVLP